MDLKHLIAVERWTFALAALVLVAMLLALGLRAGYSAALGGGLMAANAWSLRRIGERLGSAFGKRPGAALVLFNVKMGLLIALVYLALRYAGVAPVPFLIGLSTLPVAIVVVALQHAARKEEQDTHG